MNNKIKMIIFDMDGTLYPNNENINRVYPQACLKLLSEKYNRQAKDIEISFNREKEELAGIINGQPTNTLTLLYYHDISFEEFENEVNSRIEIEKVLNFDEKSVNTLKTISSNYETCLYTTNVEKCTSRILTHLGFNDIFPEEKRYTLSRMGRLDLPRKKQLEFVKPGKKGFEMIIENCGFSKDEILMVGDSEVSDINPARSLGLNTYRISSPQDLYNLTGYLDIR